MPEPSRFRRPVRVRASRILTCLLVPLLLPIAAGAQDVLTHSYDNARTSANTGETILFPGNVNGQAFGKLFSYPVKGSIYAQPLYLSDYDGSGTNAVYTATMGNWVYAFDADGKTQAPLWKRQLLTPAQLQSPCMGYVGYKDIAVEAGVLSTPVIAPDKKSIYLISISQKPITDGFRYTYTIYQLSTTTGAIIAENAFASTSCVGGDLTADPPVLGISPGNEAFKVDRQGQRVGLLYLDDRVYAGFASFNDRSVFHGFVIGFDATTLKEVARFNTTPSKGGGGVWMSNQGLASDGTSIYFMTGNGYYKTGTDLSQSFVRLNTDLELEDWFTPCNVFCLNAADLDLGTAGVVVLPDDLYTPEGAKEPKQLVLGGGKEGRIYVVDRNDMGNLSRDNRQIQQSFCAGGHCGDCGSPRGGPNGEFSAKMPGCFPPDATGPSMNYAIRGTPVFWQGPNGPQIFVWPQSNPLQAYDFDTRTGLFTASAFGNGPQTPQYPGGILALSSNGTLDGIVWAAMVSRGYGSANQMIVPGVLRAYAANPNRYHGDPQELVELWNSDTKPSDKLGHLAKFTPPVVINGKVYMATQGIKAELEHPPNPAALVVYGLLPTPQK